MDHHTILYQQSWVPDNRFMTFLLWCHHREILYYIILLMWNDIRHLLRPQLLWYIPTCTVPVLAQNALNIKPSSHKSHFHFVVVAKLAAAAVRICKLALYLVLIPLLFSLKQWPLCSVLSHVPSFSASSSSPSILGSFVTILYTFPAKASYLSSLWKQHHVKFWRRVVDCLVSSPDWWLEKSLEAVISATSLHC